MPSSAHFRNFIITTFVLVLVFVAAGWDRLFSVSRPVTLAAPLQAASYSWSPSSPQSFSVPAGQTTSYPSSGNLRITNTGTESETLPVSISHDFPSGTGWSATLDPNMSSVTLGPDEYQDFKVLIAAPSDADVNATYTVRVRAVSTAAAAEYQFILNVSVTDPTPTPTPTRTTTPETERVDINMVSKDPSSGKKNGEPGEAVKYVLTLSNPGTSSQRYRISVVRSCNEDISGASETLSMTSVELANGSSRDFEVYVILPSDAPLEDSCKTEVRAEVEADTTVWKSVLLETTVHETVDTPTPTRTPTPLGRICKDIFEEDNVFDHASSIDVNVPQPNPNPTPDDPDDRRSICPQDDEDWIKFGAISGKIYSIDVPKMADGIDLSLELFDEHGNSIAFNDDYFQRDDDDGGPEDIRPRIESWRAPFDGTYYIRVRDAAGRGGVDRTYTIQVLTESYGPTPITLGEVCQDQFEPDGLPEQAALITSNERQKDRRLCPTGDADWITFFGKAGKRYFIYTDTSPYGEERVNDTLAGADTILVLTDRDGRATLDYNDDISGGDTLDSQVEFIPEVDGFYYVQIKNIGDIGNQFIRYDLVLELCKPGQTNCGRTSNPTTRTSSKVNPSVTAVPVSASTPTIPNEEFALDATSTPTVTPAGTGNQMGDSADNVAYSALGFANETFWNVWQHTDQPVQDQRVARDWLWGPVPMAIRSELYQQAAGGVRQVQYFDKGRMEINDPAADASHPWFVTFGLLAEELINHHIQVGDLEYQMLQPADIVLLGDVSDPSTPTYASFQSVIGVPAPDLTGEDAVGTLNRDGQMGVYGGTRYPEARLTSFVPDTGHNIPQVFWRYLNEHGETYEQGTYTVGPLMDWTRVVGYPLSEPYWIQTHIDGLPYDVLIQVYQRRVLFFIPNAPSGITVQMADIGRHYYQWRYGELLP